MIKKIVLISILFSISVKAKKIIITGSSTIAPVLSDIAKQYESEKANSDIRIDIQTGGSSRGVADIRRGISQIGMVSRKLKFEEKNLKSFLFALDGISIILHQNNPIKELSKQQIIDIYTGKITNWKALGGDNKKIVVVNKAEGRSTLELFLKYFHLKNSQIKSHIIVGDNEQGIKSVASSESSIGYVSVGAAEYNVSIGVPLKLLPMEGIPASVENIAAGNYPLMRQLNLITNKIPNVEIVKFIKYVKSAASVELIKEHYFVPYKSK